VGAPGRRRWPRSRARGRECPCRGSAGCRCACRGGRGQGQIYIAAPSSTVRQAHLHLQVRRTLQASARSWSKHMPSWTRRTRAWGSMLPAKGSVSGSRIQHRERWRAALPKPASWRYRHTRPRVRDAGQGSGGPGTGTEVVDRVAAESLRHGAFCERCRRLRWVVDWKWGVEAVGSGRRCCESCDDGLDSAMPDELVL
jgi:hypothetical protein